MSSQKLYLLFLNDDGIRDLSLLKVLKQFMKTFNPDSPSKLAVVTRPTSHKRNDCFGEVMQIQAHPFREYITLD